MNPEMISNVLDKLRQKTGREWTLADLLHLANKLPELQEKGMDAVFAELADMGLELSEDAKEKISNKIQDGTVDSLKNQVEQTGYSKTRRGSALGKRKSSKQEQLRAQIRKAQKTRKKKK